MLPASNQTARKQISLADLYQADDSGKVLQHNLQKTYLHQAITLARHYPGNGHDGHNWHGRFDCPKYAARQALPTHPGNNTRNAGTYRGGTASCLPVILFLPCIMLLPVCLPSH